MNDKVLLFSKYNFDEFQGGPSGFIRQNILSNNIKGLTTLQKLQQEFKPNFLKKIKISLYQKFRKRDNNNWLKQHLTTAAATYKYYNCNRFKYIYFHDIFSLYGCLKLIPAFQKIILQSHAPELVSDEFRNLGSSGNLLDKIQEIETITFKKADYLIFPNIDASLIYKPLIPVNSKISYILSASQTINNPCTIPLDRNAVNLLFIGRRNHIKGFDILIETFEKIRYLRQDINLFLAGDGEEINQHGVISLGKVNPANWIKSVDYVINVNQNSYFDLSVMEVLSIGTPIILTLTGGHIFFKNKSEGIIELDNLSGNELFSILSTIQKQKPDVKAKMIKSNRDLYNNFFTPQLYKERLEKFIVQLN